MEYVGNCKHCDAPLYRDDMDRIRCNVPSDVCLCDLAEPDTTNWPSIADAIEEQAEGFGNTEIEKDIRTRIVALADYIRGKV